MLSLDVLAGAGVPKVALFTELGTLALLHGPQSQLGQIGFPHSMVFQGSQRATAETARIPNFICPNKLQDQSTIKRKGNRCQKGGTTKYCCHVFKQLYYVTCFGSRDFENCLLLELSSQKMRDHRREVPLILAIPNVPRHLRNPSHGPRWVSIWPQQNCLSIRETTQTIT